MTVAQAVSQLLEIEEKRGEGIAAPDSIGVGLARVGADNQLIVAAPLRELRDADLGGPLHTLVLVGDVHVMEQEVLDQYRLNPSASAAKAD
jgi:diphthine synthase